MRLLRDIGRSAERPCAGGEPGGRRWRFWLEVLLAAASGLLGLITLVWRDWIEAVFGADPDHHSGSLEWLIVFGLLAAALILGLVARAEFNRTTAPRLLGDQRPSSDSSRSNTLM